MYKNYLSCADKGDKSYYLPEATVKRNGQEKSQMPSKEAASFR